MKAITITTLSLALFLLGTFALTLPGRGAGDAQARAGVCVEVGSEHYFDAAVRGPVGGVRVGPWARVCPISAR